MTEQHQPAGDNGSRNGSLARTLGGLGGLTSVQPFTGGGRVRISDFVYSELSEAIRDLRLPPGTPLSEPAVAASLQVSRAPVREAFTRLADQGLVTIVPQVGSQVAPISMASVNDAVFIRSALEKSAFQQAIGFEDLDTAALQELVDRNRDAAAAGDQEAFIQTDEELHQLVFALAGVPQIWQVVRGAKVHLDRLRRLNLSAAIANPEIAAEHQLIVDAMTRHDEAGGLRVIHRHSTRIIDDTGKLRQEFPDYFIS
jgi:DNA-binding GntR family transcriptional regulator